MLETSLKSGGTVFSNRRAGIRGLAKMRTFMTSSLSLGRK